VISGIFSSIRYALRAFRRNRVFTAVTVGPLALGIGANTAVFTLLDQLVLRLLPVKQPEQLVMIWPTEPYMGNSDGERVTSYPMYQDFQRRAQAFDFVFAKFDQQVAMSFHGSTERADGEQVSGNYVQALGVRPALGRVFSPEADDRGYHWGGAFSVEGHQAKDGEDMDAGNNIVPRVTGGRWVCRCWRAAISTPATGSTAATRSRCPRLLSSTGVLRSISLGSRAPLAGTSAKETAARRNRAFKSSER
jgi:hypothetical protein